MVPEHTVLSYTLGIEFGADFVEPDVVSTKDGVLVCRHDVTLGDSTNVGTRPEFASRRRTRELVWPYRHNVTGWFVQVTLNACPLGGENGWLKRHTRAAPSLASLAKQDFTFAELKTLLAVSRDTRGSGPLDSQFRILR